jgi:hypothetical protein
MPATAESAAAIQSGETCNRLINDTARLMQSVATLAGLFRLNNRAWPTRAFFHRGVVSGNALPIEQRSLFQGLT